MKRKDLIALGLLGVILIVIGSVLVSQFDLGGPRQAEVEVVRPIEPQFNEEARAILLGTSEEEQIESVPAPVDTEGLGNDSPFRAED